jgi:DNA (cytosine-5)-methyltransferase 1
VDYTEQSPAILSLCTGMRGLERGIERAIGSVRTIAYVEIEAFVIENLVRQMEQGLLAPAPVWSNLKTFPSEQFHGKIHGITGGYPCQPFSVAGKRNGTEDPRHLWPHIKRMVGAIRPVFCFFENVPGHLTLGYREVRSDLEQLGYTVEEGIFSAEEVGAPHQRKRLFILAVKMEYSKSWRSGGLQNKVSEGQRYGASRTGGVLQSGGEELDYPNLNGQQQEHQISAGGNSVEYAGEAELANTGRIGSERPKQQATGIEQCSEGDLADTTEQRMEGNGAEGEQESNSHERSGLPVCGSGRDRWPARPGEEQHEWEAPRVESSVGFTINGYNFREDLLRMAGNGVVEQTAELAWKTLWNKF